MMNRKNPLDACAAATLLDLSEAALAKRQEGAPLRVRTSLRAGVGASSGTDHTTTSEGGGVSGSGSSGSSSGGSSAGGSGNSGSGLPLLM